MRAATWPEGSQSVAFLPCWPRGERTRPAPRLYSASIGNRREKRNCAVGVVIAARLSLSLKTVQNHVSNILSKLQVADRAQASVRAREAGLGR